MTDNTSSKKNKEIVFSAEDGTSITLPELKEKLLETIAENPAWSQKDGTISNWALPYALKEIKPPLSYQLRSNIDTAVAGHFHLITSTGKVDRADPFDFDTFEKFCHAIDGNFDAFFKVAMEKSGKDFNNLDMFIDEINSFKKPTKLDNVVGSDEVIYFYELYNQISGIYEENDVRGILSDAVKDLKTPVSFDNEHTMKSPPSHTATPLQKGGQSL